MSGKGKTGGKGKGTGGKATSKSAKAGLRALADYGERDMGPHPGKHKRKTEEHLDQNAAAEIARDTVARAQRVETQATVSVSSGPDLLELLGHRAPVAPAEPASPPLRRTRSAALRAMRSLD